MKRVYVSFLFCAMLFFPICLFAQTAKVVDLKGKVQIKAGDAASWEKARLNMLLGKQAEVKTDKDSSCTLAFDEEMKNILTVNENSYIKIENLKPGKIFLPEGRVFSLIKNMAKVDQFQIRTPTAIAGARGTGWESRNHEGRSSFLCFEDTIHVEGVDNEGNVTGESDLGSGFGMDVGEGGMMGGQFGLKDTDYESWNSFTDNVGAVTGTGDNAGDTGSAADNNSADVSDLKEDQRQDFQANNAETTRQQEEHTSDSGGGKYDGNGPY
jgi:hypothetical protein